MRSTMISRRFMFLACGALGCGGAESIGTPGTTSTTTGSTAPTDEGDEDPGSGAPTSTSSIDETTGAGGTSGSSTSGSSSGSTTTETEPGWCGDGVLNSAEECDQGVDLNDDHAYCTKSCKFNVCGDGLVLKDWEFCDDGLGNSDSYGSTCTKQCTPGARCGDGTIDVGFEECDLGVGNNTSQGDEQGITCTSMCRMNALRAFLSSQAASGDFDGLEGADGWCQTLALAANLPEYWRFSAFLSSGLVSVNARFADMIDDTKPYVLLSGKKIAASYTALVTGGPEVPGISETEQGETLMFARVATNTASGGNVASADLHCDTWSSASADLSAHTGLSTPENAAEWDAWALGGWTSYETRWCSKPMHVYCLEF